MQFMERRRIRAFLHKESLVSSPCKKQKKYNLARWSVTGRDDANLNSSCYRIYNKLTKASNNNYDDWLDLLFLWSSDHRTHLTSLKWKNIKKVIQEDKPIAK